MNVKNLSTLQIALGLSVLAHAALLAVRFVDPQSFDRMFEETPLEVILVNASTKERPEKATAVAQKSMAGGGDLDRGRATSPLPPSAFTAIGDSSEDAQRQVEAMQAQQMLLLSQLKRQLATLAVPDAQQQQQNSPVEAAAREEKRRQLVNLLAEIERRVNEENARPRKLYVSPSTREVAYATYVDSLRRRIEARGTENFPEIAGRKLYGELTMMVTVNHDGRLIGMEIVASSGNVALDRRAQAIVSSIGNFGAFSPAMRRQADQIVLPSRFRFTRDETLETQSSVSQ